MRSDKGFSNWMDDRNRNDDKDETFSFLGIGMQMKGVQENFASQMMELSGALPDTPLNENFRNRLFSVKTYFKGFLMCFDNVLRCNSN